MIPELDGYRQLDVYFGDLHNHCDLSYGRGSLQDALSNARLQLDFASVTVHAVWPDLPKDDPKLDYLVEYHNVGFAKAQRNWPAYLHAIDQANEAGHFVTFPSFEWHSNEFGDYCVYYKQAAGVPIVEARDLYELRSAVSGHKTPGILIPHHIGYRQGSRGINWRAFSSELSPVAEIFSFHGLSESSEGPYPYLHTMGPRHEQSTAQYGWAQGHIFGVIGSTDHHNAFPGSYGYGRLAVWAESLSRDALWDALLRRRAYALTGDRIELAFAVNGRPMGDICPASPERWIEVSVRGGGAIDSIDLLHNNQLVHRQIIPTARDRHGLFKVHLEMGWGERAEPTEWDVTLHVVGGRFASIEPRFRGYGPTDAPEGDDFAFCSWEQVDEHQIRAETRTRQNPSLHTAATEGIAFEVEGDSETIILATVNGKQYEVPLAELFEGSRSFYLGGFVSPAFCFHRAVPHAEYTHRFALLHRSRSQTRDWYYVRVRQINDQWAWSSPIWVEP